MAYWKKLTAADWWIVAMVSLLVATFVPRTVDWGRDNLFLHDRAQIGVDERQQIDERVKALEVMLGKIQDAD